jgi:hypothetical protein
MKLSDPNNPNEKKKMIAAAALGLVALIVLGYVLFGGSSKPANNSNRPVVQTSPTPRPPGTVVAGVDEGGPDTCSYCQKITYPGVAPQITEASRNIFAFYIPPSPTPKPQPTLPPPSPTPPPPLIASSLSPSNVYAGTPADFALQVSGDKFTPAVHVFVDDRDVATRFISAQQVFATVPANLILNPGVRKVEVRTPDRKLYSNVLSINVTPAPVPNYTYVGLIGKPRYNDTAVLQDKSSKEFLNVQRGDPVGNRFKVVSISDKEVRLIDTTLKITHRILFSTDQSSTGPYRPPTRAVDDEP